MSAAGPAGAPVMQGIIKRKYSQVAAGSGVLTVLAGLMLFWLDSDHFRSTVWMHSMSSTAYQVGGGAAIIALIIGISVTRPTVGKMVALSAAASPGNPPPAAEMARLQGRLRTSGRAVAALLTITLICMAMARYL